MSNQKIAIVVDTGSDLPEAYREYDNVFVVPFKIIYKDREYSDGVDITPREIYDNLNVEIPKTSLPSGQDILNTFDTIIAQGYTSVLVVSVSSKLSGTHNMMSLMAKSISDIDIYVLDTKSIGLAVGQFAMDAITQVQNGISFEALIERMENQVKQSRVFFSVGTLEYLQKGGRIGLVSSLLGSALKIKPVITCNKDGIYETISKARGRKQSIQKMLELAEAFEANHKKAYIGICYGVKNEEYFLFREKLAESPLSKYDIVEVELGAALGIHSGPEMFGIAVYLLPE